MSDLDRMRLAVAGAGVFGLCVALRATLAGARVEVFDPAAASDNAPDNASAVAAGMIAPIGEALFDPEGAAPLPLLRAGRDGWGEIEAAAPGLEIQRTGARLFWPDGEASSSEARLNALGVEATRLAPLTPGRQGVFTPEDWRIAPIPALAALRKAIAAHGGVFTTASLTPEAISIDTKLSSSPPAGKALRSPAWRRNLAYCSRSRVNWSAFRARRWADRSCDAVRSMWRRKRGAPWPARPWSRGEATGASTRRRWIGSPPSPARWSPP